MNIARNGCFRANVKGGEGNDKKRKMPIISQRYKSFDVCRKDVADENGSLMNSRILNFALTILLSLEQTKTSMSRDKSSASRLRDNQLPSRH